MSTVSQILSEYILIIVGLLIGLMAFCVWLIFKNKKIKNRNLQIEQQLLLSQMNPHFVFNSLTAIQSYIFRNEAHLASKYLASFAKLTRLILENSRMELNSLEREVTTLKHYLELQSLRFEGRFEYKITVDENIDIDSVQIPPMLAQPFIENAIEHGFIHTSDKGMLVIDFKSQDGKLLVISVEDNGIGIKKSRQQQIKAGKSHRSLATEITQERIKKIRQSKKIKIELDIFDISELDITQHGTLVKFKIPVLC